MTDMEALCIRAQSIRELLTALTKQTDSLGRDIEIADGNSSAVGDVKYAAWRMSNALQCWDKAIAEMSAAVAVAALPADASEEAYHKACAQGDPRWRAPA